MKIEETKGKKAVTSEKKVTTKKTQTKKQEKTKKVTSASKTTKKDVAPKKAPSTTKKASTTKTSATKKVDSSKSTKKAVTKKATSTSKVKRTTTKVSVMEYYDLPYRYNQTVVKILAQTPNMLFVYWDISDDDKTDFINKYGNNFFKETKPVLIIHNETMNYYFEIEINDFANSWYLHVNDANCKYEVELGRRPLLYNNTIKEGYIYISSSNKLDIPNDHVLFEEFNPNVTYKNVKTGNITKKDFSKSLPYNLYKKLYMDKEIFRDLLDGKFTNSSSSPSF